MSVPIRVRLSAVMIVTFSVGVRTYQPLRKAQVRLGHRDGELTVEVLIERHVVLVETFPICLAKSERINGPIFFVTAERQETGSKR